MLVAQKNMQPSIEIRPSTPQDVALMKNHLRPADAREVLCLGVTPQKALWLSYKRSTLRKTAFVGGEIAAMGGLHATTMGETGVPWLLTTEAVRKITPLRFVHIYQTEVLRMLEIFPRL